MADLFLDSNEVIEVAAGVRVLGRSGGAEGVAVQSGVQGVEVDANIERIDFSQNSSDIEFQVTGDGLAIRSAGTQIASVLSLNQSANFRFADGDVTVQQTGATTFELTGSDGSTQTVDATSGSSVTVPLGGQTSSTAVADGSGDSGGSGGGGTSPADTLRGNVQVDGAAASTLPSSANTVTVGASGSDGGLDLRDGNGLTIEPGDQDDSARPGLTVGADADSNGDVLVADQGSALNIQDASQTPTDGPFLRLGQAFGAGNLTIRDDGAVSLDGGQTTLTMSTAPPDLNGPPPDGTTVPESRLTIESGGTLSLNSQSFSNFDIAPHAVGDASVKVRGSDSSLSIAGNTATLYVGKAGTGQLSIDDGGTVETMYASAGGALLPPGAEAEDFPTGGVGHIAVDGQGSELIASGIGGRLGEGASIAIGRSGSGTLSVTNGGSIAISSSDNVFPGLSVGDAQGTTGTGASGTVVVDGRNSSITVSSNGGAPDDSGTAGRIDIGHANGTGHLTVRDGADVTNAPIGTTYVGVDGPNADGSVIVTGEDSRLDAGSDLVIGGGVESQDGGTSLVFENPGHGTVRVANGATLAAGENQNDDNTDILVGDDGRLQIASDARLVGDVATDAGGTFAPGDSIGRAVVDGDITLDGDTVFEFAGPRNGEFDRIEVLGAATLGGEVIVEFQRGFQPAAGDTFTIMDAADGATLPSEAAVSTDGLPDDLDVELSAQGSSIVANVVSVSDNQDGMS